MYIAIPVTVSAFAAYGPVYVLLCNFFLIPIFLRRREDPLTPILAVMSAVFSYFLISASIPTPINSGVATVTLTWSENVKIDGGKMKGFAKSATGEILYVIYAFENEAEKSRFQHTLPASYTFTMSGSFREPTIPSHDYSFNMQNYLRMYGAAGMFETDTILQIQKKDGFLTRLAEHRRNVKNHIASTFPSSLRVEAEALLIGDRSGMDEALASEYRTLGITHLFAISGLHVGLLAFLLRGFLLRCKVRKETVDTLLIVLLPLYALIAGGAPSVWRAVSVAILVLLASSGRIRLRVDDALAFSAVFFICLQPFIIFQPGFQLSYLAATSLVLSTKILARAQSPIGISFIVTSISQITLYPVILLHFHELSISSFVVNLLYVPLYSIFILPANIILLILTWILPGLASFIFILYEPLRDVISIFTTWLASLPYQLWTPGKPTVYCVAVAVGGVLWFFIHCEEGRKLYNSLPLIILPALIIHFTPYANSALRVTFLDVGQGDSIVIELPYRKAVYVIDTGGTIQLGDATWKTPEKKFEVGRKVVVPYLKGRGISTIDKLIITHADSDHMEGADEVLEEVRVNEIHISPGSDKEKTMEEVVQFAVTHKIPIIPMKEGVSWSEGQTTFYYVGPKDGRYEGNNSSLVLYMTTFGPSFLFTGDMEEQGEIEFIRDYGHSDFGSLILKAGHHGSRTSSTKPFIEALLPELTIFSAGRNNRYGHPHPEVVNNFRKLGLQSMSTADFGSITIHVTKDGYCISAMK